MTRGDFVTMLKQNFERAISIVQAKNQDYAAETDPFKNFRFAELVGVGIERAILVRMSDKLARISNILEKENVVKDETIEDTLIDLMNYTDILLVRIQSEKLNKTKKLNA